MKVWIEPIRTPGNDGWLERRYAVVTAEGQSAVGDKSFFSAVEARERARAAGYQVMDVKRPSR